MDELHFDRELEGTTKLITSLNINQESASSKPGRLMMNTIHYRGSIHFFLVSLLVIGDGGGLSRRLQRLAAGNLSVLKYNKYYVSLSYTSYTFIALHRLWAE